MLQAIEKELNARERSGVTEACQLQQHNDKQTAATLISASSQPVCCYCSSICHQSASSRVDNQYAVSNRRVPPNQPSNTSTQPPATQGSLLTVQNPSTPTTLLNPTAPTFTSTPTSTSLYVGSSKAMLLQTALAEVYNLDNPSLTL